MILEARFARPARPLSLVSAMPHGAEPRDDGLWLWSRRTPPSFQFNILDGTMCWARQAASFRCRAGETYQPCGKMAPSDNEEEVKRK
jgi:hypothetical protein